jgi:hypothetical protein
MRGDHLIVDRGMYRHHAIDCGDGKVVHFSGSKNEKVSVSVRLDTYENFARARTVLVRGYGLRLDPDETIRLGKALIGVSGYDLISNNCEHLVSSCITGVPESRQVERAAACTGSFVAIMAANHLSGDVLTRVGSVKGLSGPGVMSAMAQIGGLVDGGAVEGLYLLGLIPATASVAGVFYATKNKPHLTDNERRARLAARIAAIAGATLTGLLEIQLLSAIGGVKGLSGPGIASGLSTVGSSSDGGMVAGAGVLVAAPAAMAALFGWFAYQVAIRWPTQLPPIQAAAADAL